MPAAKLIADILIKKCGLRHLHGTRVAWALRNVLLEIDLQHFRDTHPCPNCADRKEMYRYVHTSLIGEDPIDYLEFGVFEGDSIRYWADLNQVPSSRFFGFDSFEGLPQQWGAFDKGAFDKGGAIPEIHDERVEFVKGWFSDTIPTFGRGFIPRSRVVLHLDADLYGSTMLALVQLGPYLPGGTLVFFDEFFARDHEFRAFMDWQAIYGQNFRLVAETGDYAQICAELL